MILATAPVRLDQAEREHPPLVDPSTFEQVQRVLSDHCTAGERPSKREHYLVAACAAAAAASGCCTP
jgi:hypothetical protein